MSTAQERWDIAEVVGTGEVTLASEADAPSPPAVMRSEVDEPPTGSTAPYHSARVSFQPRRPGYETDTPLLRLAMSVRVVELADDNPGVSIANIRYGADEAYVTLALQPESPTEARLLYYSSVDAILSDVATLTVGDWVDLRLSVAARNAAAGEPIGAGVTVEVNGSPRTFMAPAAALTDALRFDVGVASSNPDARRAVVQLDDVAIDFE